MINFYMEIKAKTIEEQLKKNNLKKNIRKKTILADKKV